MPAEDPDAADGPLDHRNAALLVDKERREFLADLDPRVVNSYAVLYARAEKWINYAKREAQRSQKLELPDNDKWTRLEERWRTSLRWLDRNLVMSGSVRGRRADQLVEVLSGGRDPPSVGGTQVVIPQVYQQESPAAKRPSLWRR